MPRNIGNIGAPPSPSNSNGLLNQAERLIAIAGDKATEIYDRRTQSNISRDMESRLLKQQRSLQSVMNELRSKEVRGKITLSQEFKQSLNRAMENFSVSIARAHGTTAIRDLASDRAAKYRTLRKAITSGRYDRIQNAQIEVGNITSQHLTELGERRKKAEAELQKAKGLKNQESKQVVLNSQETVKAIDRETKAVVGDVAAWKKQIEITTQWSKVSNRTLKMPGGGTIELPFISPRMMPFITGGMKSGMRAMAPFGSLGRLVGGVGGAVFGGMHGLRAKSGAGGNLSGALETVGALADNPYLMAVGAVGALGKAAYGLSSEAWNYQKQAYIGALTMGMGRGGSLNQFQAMAGLSIGIGKGNTVLGLNQKTPAGLLAHKLGIGPHEALDLITGYGGAYNTKGGFDPRALYSATRAPYLAGISPDLLSTIGQFGYTSKGLSNESVFGDLQHAVKQGVEGGMSSSETARAFLSIQRSMAVGTGLGIASAGHVYSTFFGLRNNIAEFSSPEGIAAATSAMAHSGANAVSNPFGFSLLNSALMGAKGKNLKERLQSLMPRGEFNRLWSSLLPGFKKDFTQGGPNFLSTMALGQANLLGPRAGVIISDVLDRMKLNPTSKFLLLNQQLQNAPAAEFLANATSKQKEWFLATGWKKFDKTENFIDLDQNTKDMLDVLKDIRTIENIRLGAETFSSPMGPMLRRFEYFFGHTFDPSLGGDVGGPYSSDGSGSKYLPPEWKPGYVSPFKKHMEDWWHMHGAPVTGRIVKKAVTHGWVPPVGP